MTLLTTPVSHPLNRLAKTIRPRIKVAINPSSRANLFPISSTRGSLGHALKSPFPASIRLYEETTGVLASMEATKKPELPLPLLDLLYNSVILNNTIPYLPLASIFSLSRTSKSFKSLLHQNPNVFNYVDLSKCKGAYTPLMSKIDTGGHSWRAERMDENLTEDEFYAGPLRGTLYKLKKMQVLSSIHSLVLDGLASVTNDLLYDLIAGDGYNIRLLSIRRCLNVNQNKLQQLLTHLCRPSRPEGTPRLQGLYVFTDPGATMPSKASTGITATDGAQLGAPPSQKLLSATTGDSCYSPFGQIMQQGYKQRTSWEETIAACRGLIWFDAVLCEAMHIAMAEVIYDSPRASELLSKPSHRPMATIALGPDGCTDCGFNPSDSPVWGRDDLSQFPLLWPPPHSGKLIDALRPPRQADGKPARLVVSCSWCMENRYCETCHRWWCLNCYNTTKADNLQSSQAFRDLSMDEYLSGRQIRIPRGKGIKVFNGFCVENCLVGEYYGAGLGGMWG